MVAEKFSTIVVAAVFLSFAWNRDRTIVNSKEIEMMMISLIRNGTSLRKQSHCKESDLDTVPSLDLCLSLVVCDSYILKAKKFAGLPFQSKKIAEKVRKFGRHFWAILGNFR